MAFALVGGRIKNEDVGDAVSGQEIYFWNRSKPAEHGARRVQEFHSWPTRRALLCRLTRLMMSLLYGAGKCFDALLIVAALPSRNPEPVAAGSMSGIEIVASRRSTQAAPAAARYGSLESRAIARRGPCFSISHGLSLLVGLISPWPPEAKHAAFWRGFGRRTSVSARGAAGRRPRIDADRTPPCRRLATVIGRGRRRCHARGARGIDQFAADLKPPIVESWFQSFRIFNESLDLPAGNGLRAFRVLIAREILGVCRSCINGTMRGRSPFKSRSTILSAPGKRPRSFALSPPRIGGGSSLRHRIALATLRSRQSNG